MALMIGAGLYLKENATLVKTGDPSMIVKQYLSFSVTRKQRYCVKYEGRTYIGDDARHLLDDLEGAKLEP